MTPNRNKKDGIALVAVLGFLGVMLLMAVALSISMRTERLISESGLDDVRTRQLVRTGLARAMADINQFMIETDPTTGDPALPAQQPAMIHLPREYALFRSISTDGSADKLESDADLISGEMLDWLPAKYLVTDGGVFDAAAEAANAEWINIRDPNTNIILGRVAYLLADCTGLLDVNLINDGGNPVRTEGASVGEINAKLLPEIREESRALNLDKNKSFYHRFDSLPEIIYLNDGIGGSDSYKEPLAVSGSLLNNLAPYSLAYDRGWWNWSATPSSRGWTNGYSDSLGRSIPLDINEWTNQEGSAAAVFERVGFADFPGQAGLMETCFWDYVDTDFIPGGLGTANPNVPCCEPIPMITEISAAAQASYDMTNYYLDVYVDVKVSYPFAGIENPRSYVLDYHSVGITLPSSWVPVPVPVPFPAGATSTAPFTAAAGGDWYHHPVPFRVRGSSTSWPPGLFINVVLRNFDIRLRDGSDYVDQTPLGTAALLLGPISRPPAAGGSSPLVLCRQSLHCNDPRVNHLPGTEEWQLAPRLLNNAQSAGIIFGSQSYNYATNGTVEGYPSYVRNGPMQNAGELGFISVGRPWTTIDLTSLRGSELLSKFRVGSAPADSPYFSGKINPHSLNTSVWSAVLSDCPMEQYPNDSGAKLVDPALAGLLAKAITDYNAENKSWGTNSFEGLADWTAIPALRRAPNDNWGGPVNNNMQVEGVIRNSYRLFNPNQNLFTIIVVAQAINDQGVRGSFDSNTDTILGEKRAVALVWRDPFMGKAGRNEMFIRMFRYIDQ